jgi:hypothetical protein
MKIKKEKKIGGSTLTPDELNRIRDTSRLCCNNQKVIKFVENITNSIVDLVKNYAISHNRDVDMELLKRFHQDTKISPGQVKDLDAVKAVIANGNLRERMALIMNFGITGCDIIIWAISTNNKLLKPEFIKKQSERVKILTGIEMNELHKKLECKRDAKLTCSELENVPCTFGLFTRDGPVILSRYTEFPMYNSARIKRPELVELDNLKKLLENILDGNGKKKELIEKITNMIMDANNKKYNEYNMTIKDIYPLLSDREILFLKDNDIDTDNPDSFPPYVSGYMYWDTNENNYYNKLAKLNNQLVVAGPSGNTDLFLSTCSMFKDLNLKTNLNLGILACIAWMCNIPQHSVFEILMGALPFGLNDWNPSNKDAIDYVIELNKKEMPLPISATRVIKGSTTRATRATRS